MRRLVIGVAAVTLAACGDGEGDEFVPDEPMPDKVDLFSAIDPRIGTAGVGFGVGSTYPGPALPFAMIHPSPDTRTKTGALDFYHCAGYYAEDPIIGGFSLLHFEGTGVPDYGTVGLMPTLGMSEAKRTQAGHMRAFDKGSEETKPGYYAAVLDDGIRVEITSARRAALFRFTFPSSGEPVLLLDLAQKLKGTIPAADVTLDAAGSFDAHVRHLGSMSGGAGGYDVFARGVVDVKPTAVGTFDATGLNPGSVKVAGDPSGGGSAETPLGAWLEFPQGTKAVTLRIAVSFVDAEGAKKNLQDEAAGFDFDGMRADAEATWRELMSRVEIHGASDYDTSLQATALYHAALMPTLTSDADGRFVDAMGKVRTGTRDRYNDFSLWDTYRTLHPWWMLMEDARNEAFVGSLVDMADEGGAVPVWGIGHGDSKTMIGSPGEIVLSEAAQKGVPFDDEAKAYTLARVAAYQASPGPIGGRDGDLPDYLQHGFVPQEASNGSVSKTQEYAVADAALAAWALRLGKDADAEELAKRGKGYAAVYDSDLGFFHARRADGSFAAMGAPEDMSNDYVEGNAWHYLWMVPHDPDGLAETLGGRDAALTRLREFFTTSKEEVPIIGVRKHYWPSNEPDINAPFLFAAWGSPHESWDAVDWIVNDLYGTGVDGIPGNDDGGTMSAWLLFAGAGLYPVSGTDQYIVSVPRYRRMVLKRTAGDLEIETNRTPRAGLRVHRVLLDGQAVAGTTIRHEQLSGSRHLRVELR
ncbi:MAG: GH92 family glycosyl hydrolase [Polyangiaceae bacterium]